MAFRARTDARKPPVIEKRIQILPLLPLRDVVIFPHMVAPLLVGREKSIAAVEKAMKGPRLILLVAQKEASVEDPQPEDLYAVGSVGEILQVLKLPDKSVKVLVEGKRRARVREYVKRDPFFEVKAQRLDEVPLKTPEVDILTRTVVDDFQQFVKLSPRIPSEIVAPVKSVTDPERVVDTIAGYLSVKIEDRQEILRETDLLKRLRKLHQALTAEIEILQMELKIHGEVHKQMEKTQKEYYLQEQMRAIQKELGKADERAADMEELRKKIAEAGMSKEAEEKALRETDRLGRMMPSSPEATVSQTYLDWLLALPWAKMTKDRLNIERAKKILDEDHHALQKPKERILEFLAVRKLVKKMKGPILCFVGPPGVGKTSLARSVARALGRNFVRVSLGGMRDEAEIRGHRRTYIGALPGRIIQNIRKAKSRNPLFLLDEVDKMSVDFRGDPSSALLEVLDPEQNNTFNDHYLEVDFDLSDIFFITTANVQYAIPPPLQDRMEIIPLPGYTEMEKVRIAERFLIPKQMKANGLRKNDVQIGRQTVEAIIHNYTREAGVRNLEREISSICRKVAKQIASKGRKRARTPVRITARGLHPYLGPRRFLETKAEKQDEIGVAMGMAWTEAGGDIMSTEASIMQGKGKLTLTGKMGDVMQESGRAAMSYIRSRSGELGLQADFYKGIDVHIHVPEGAIPKDGPSAGITMATALASALTRIPVHRDVVMTGEITLRGRILPIGGVKSKVLAAHRSGMRTVVMPKDNQKDIEDIPAKVRRELKFVLVENMDEVLQVALLRMPGEKETEKEVPLPARGGKREQPPAYM